MQDQIEKRIELKAPVSRVWRAVTDHREFGEWFGVKLEGPFVPGRVTNGKMANPKYEHLKLEATVKELQPERLFSYTWHPYAMDPNVDYSKETPTLVEFRLEKIPTGTLLVVTRVRIRQDPRSPARRGLPYGRWWLDITDQEHRAPCCDKTRSAAPRRRMYAPIFAALGDETRLAIVAKLSEGEHRSIAQLTEGTRLTRQAVTKHLRVLERAKIVRSVRAGRENSVRVRSHADPAGQRIRGGGFRAVGSGVGPTQSLRGGVRSLPKADRNPLASRFQPYTSGVHIVEDEKFLQERSSPLL